MTTILKSVDAAVTTKDDAEAGTFEALVSVFGNTDSQNDVVDKGAFTETLKEWAAKAAKGLRLPVIWSHDWSDPYSLLGEVKSAEETADGLLVKGALDLDNPKAAQVYNQMKSGRINQFSFAATTPETPGSWSLEEDADGRVIQHLKRLDLIEVGPTLRGANTATQLVSIKSDALPAARTEAAAPPEPPAVEKAEGDGADTDADDSVPGLAASLDASIDAALSLIEDVDLSGCPPEVQQALALIGAADAVSDQLLALLGVYDPDDAPDQAGVDEAAKAATGLASIRRKAGKVLASKHVDTLKDIHGRLGGLIEAVTTTSRPMAGDEPAKADPAPETAAALAKARLAELATRKGQK